MTAISSGSNAVVTVTSNQQIAINSAPGVKAYIEATSGVPGSASKMKLANHPGGFGTYGPFGAGTVTVYAVGGDLDYDAADPLRSADDTNVTPAQIYATVSGAGFVPRGMILFGDSFSDQSWEIDSAQSTLSSRGLGPVMNMIMGNPFKPKINAGISGDTVAAMLARIETDVVPYVAAGDLVVLQGGINSIVNGATAASVIADMRTICTRLTGLGAIVSLGTVTPSILRITTSARNLALADVNRGYRQIAYDIGGVFLSDDFAAMLDSAAVYATNISTYSADDLHPNSLGAMAIARTRADSLANLALKKWPLVATNQDYKGLVYNPLAIGSNATGTNGATIGAGITGNFCPNGWTAARTGTLTAVLSKVARTDGQAGEWVRAAITGGSARDAFQWSFNLSASGVNWAAATAYPVSRVRSPTVANGFVYQVVQAGTTGGTEPVWPTTAGQTVTDNTIIWACRDLPSPGDLVEMSCEFQLSGWTGNAAVQARIVWQTAGSVDVYSQSCNLQYAGDTLPNHNPPTGVIYIPPPPAVLGATVAKGTLYIECLATAGATGNFDVCAVSARVTNR
jgi:lysophospholipase L1-like esterase